MAEVDTELVKTIVGRVLSELDKRNEPISSEASLGCRLDYEYQAPALL